MDPTRRDLLQDKYLDWLCTAPKERVPSSKNKFASDNGTTTETLRAWEKNPAFRERWEKQSKDVQGSPEKAHALLEQLYEQAMGGDIKAASLYLQATNRMQPPPIKVETTRTVRELSDEELEEMIAARAAAELGARRGEFGSVA